VKLFENSNEYNKEGDQNKEEECICGKSDAAYLFDPCAPLN
jgi:hypothetical protein